MSKQTKLTNPARRLLYFIRKAKGLKKTLTAKVALANIFELQHEDQAELFSKFSVFLKLIEDTERRITNLDHNDKDKFMKCMSPIKRAFKIPNLDSSWNNPMSQITDSDIALL